MRKPTGQRPCKMCGRTIGFIRDRAGEVTHVVDPERVYAIVQDDGTVARGWTSHYATCPGAAEVRSEQAERKSEQGRLSFLKGDS